MESNQTAFFYLNIPNMSPNKEWVPDAWQFVYCPIALSASRIYFVCRAREGAIEGSSANCHNFFKKNYFGLCL